MNLELEKRLKELGVKQESVFYWVWHQQWEETPKGLKQVEPIYVLEQWGSITNSDHYSAFTVAELGEMLPPHFRSAKGTLTYPVCHNPNSPLSTEGARCESADTEADARARCLIYLVDINL